MDEPRRLRVIQQVVTSRRAHRLMIKFGWPDGPDGLMAEVWIRMHKAALADNDRAVSKYARRCVNSALVDWARRTGKSTKDETEGFENTVSLARLSVTTVEEWVDLWPERYRLRYAGLDQEDQDRLVHHYFDGIEPKTKTERSMLNRVVRRLCAVREYSLDQLQDQDPLWEPVRYVDARRPESYDIWRQLMEEEWSCGGGDERLDNKRWNNLPRIEPPTSPYCPGCHPWFPRRGPSDQRPKDWRWWATQLDWGVLEKMA